MASERVKLVESARAAFAMQRAEADIGLPTGQRLLIAPAQMDKDALLFLSSVPILISVTDKAGALTMQRSEPGGAMAEPTVQTNESLRSKISDLSEDTLGFGGLEVHTVWQLVRNPRAVLDAWMTAGPTGGGAFARPFRLYMGFDVTPVSSSSWN